MALLWLSFLFCLVQGESVPFETGAPCMFSWAVIGSWRQNVRFEWQGSHTSTSLCIRSRRREDEDKDCLPWRITAGDLCLISLGNPFCYFFGAVGYFIKKKINIKKSTKKNQKTLQIASFEEKKKPVVDCKCFPVTQCNFLTFHLLSLSHISINLFKTQLEPLSLQLFLNVKIHLCSSCLFFLVIF